MAERSIIRVREKRQGRTEKEEEEIVAALLVFPEKETPSLLLQGPRGIYFFLVFVNSVNSNCYFCNLQQKKQALF